MYSPIGIQDLAVINAEKIEKYNKIKKKQEEGTKLSKEEEDFIKTLNWPQELLS